MHVKKLTAMRGQGKGGREKVVAEEQCDFESSCVKT